MAKKKPVPVDAAPATRMNTAERYAALKMLRLAVDAALGQAEADLSETMAATGADRFHTQLGTVSYHHGPRRTAFDDDGLLAWAQENVPWEVETVTRARDTLRKQFAPSGDDVIYKPSGEVVDFAHVHVGRDGVTVRLTDESKSHAAEAAGRILDQLPALLELES